MREESLSTLLSLSALSLSLVVSSNATALKQLIRAWGGQGIQTGKLRTDPALSSQWVVDALYTGLWKSAAYMH